MQDDLRDDELPGYAALHCQSEIGAFHKRHIVRLLKMAGQDEDAAAVEAGTKEWYYLGEGAIMPVVEKIYECQEAERQRKQAEVDKAQAELAVRVL